MTTDMQAIDIEPPGAPRPAGLRATAWRRLRRDPVSVFALTLLVLLVLAAVIGGPLAARLTGHGPNQQFANALAANARPLGVMQRTYLPPRLSEHRKGGSGGRVLLAVARLSAGWVAGYDQANAAIMIRTAQSGGIVFSTGSTDWPLALGTDAAVSQITANVIERLRCRPLVIRGPVCGEGEYIGEGEMVGAGQEVSWYVDGAQLAGAGLTEPRWQVTGGRLSTASSAAHVRTISADGDDFLTLTATATDPDGREYFGSRTVRVAAAGEYLRRRIIRALDALAFPDEQGGALVDQGAAEAELADRVIPIRLGWVKQHAQALLDLVAELEARWTADGRMADGSLRPGE